MREFTTIEEFPITGRGIGHVIHVADAPPAVDEHVILDGYEVRVGGVFWPIRRGMTAIIVNTGCRVCECRTYRHRDGVGELLDGCACGHLDIAHEHINQAARGH